MHGHGHGRHRHGSRRRRVRGFLGARLHRKIFMGFGAAILLMGLISMALASVIFKSQWGWQKEQVATFVSERFAPIWDDEAQRTELLQSVARTFQARLRLSDAQDRELEAFGGECLVVHHKLAVQREGKLLGYVSYCGQAPPHPPGFGILYLVVAGVVLWGASGFIARRISRPLQELTRVTRQIGEGKLESRVQLRRRQHDEVGELADAVNEMAERIQKQMSDQRELLAAVSHEIRTPLGHLRVLLELLERDGLPGERQRQLERELATIDRLVAELLANSRLEFGALDAKRLRAGEFTRSVLERAGVALELLHDETGDVEFVGDPTLLSRALCNLIDNAKKHANGVARVRLTKRREAGHVLLSFQVTDAGAGFADAEEDAAFRAFFRGRSGNSEASSLGLGLALVRRIAEAHGGRAWAENLPAESGGGAGVSFSIRLGEIGDQSEAPRGSSERTGVI